MAREKRLIEAVLLKDVDVPRGLTKDEVITLELTALGVNLTTTTVAMEVVEIPNDAV